MKFQATYRVTVYSQENTVIIGAHEETDPDGTTRLVQDEAQLTCKFSVQRSILSDSNKCSIQIYNLAPSTRAKIFQDLWQNWDSTTWKYVKLEAGYGDDLTQIFMGRILQAYSYRSGGQVDVITDIQAQALDLLDCNTSYTFEAGTSYKDALQTMVTTSFPNVKLGNVGELEGTFKTATTFDGNTMDNIAKLTGGNAFVDNNQLNVIMSNEVIDVPVPVINEDNGLLDTPNRRDANLEVKMLFEPHLIVGQLLEIKSSVQTDFNGQFKVIGFTHDCVISGAEAGSRTTTVNLYIGPFLPGAETIVSGEVKNNFNKVKGFEVSTVQPKVVGTWIAPVKGTITSNFGFRIAPKKGASTGHKGIDIGVVMNTPVKATASGQITASKTDKGYGNYIEIYHGIVNGVSVTSRYGHLNQRGVVVGQTVKAGEVIGLSGNTGISTGPHLHFEMRENGTPVNPLKYVRL